MTLYIGTTCRFPIKYNIALQVYNKSTSNGRLIVKKGGEIMRWILFVCTRNYVNSTILLQRSVNNRKVYARYLQSLKLKRMYKTCKINILPKLFSIFNIYSF